MRMKIRKRFLSFIFISVTFIFCLYFGAFTISKLFQQCENRVLNFADLHVNNDKIVNVLLLAYGRSGSSFTGELLTIEDDVFYVYEPSHEYQLSRKIVDAQKTVEILNDIYNCKDETLTMLGVNHLSAQEMHFFFPKTNVTKKNFNDVINNCKAARVRVIKTIRVTMEIAQQLILTKPSLNLKIVHLVRDPRGMVNSMGKQWFWGKDYIEKMSSCEFIRKDLKDSRAIPKNRYTRVRYEDLSTNVLKTAANLYGFISLPLTDNLAHYIADHTQAEKKVRHDGKEIYFSTFRNSNFDPNHWKGTLSFNEMRQIEEQCKDVLEELNYEFL